MSPVPAPPPLRAVKASLAQQWPRVHRLMQSLSPAGCDCAPLAAVRDALVADTTVAGTDRERLALSALLSQCTEAAAGCQRQRRCRPAKPATSRAAARYAAEPPYADSRQTTNTCTHMHALSHAPSIQTHNPCTILQQNPATSRVAARYAAEPPYADSRQTTDTYTHVRALPHAPSILQTHTPCTILQRTPATSRAAARYAAEPPSANSRQTTNADRKQTTNTCTHVHALPHAPSVQMHTPCTILQHNPATRVAARYVAEPPFGTSPADPRPPLALGPSTRPKPGFPRAFGLKSAAPDFDPCASEEGGATERSFTPREDSRSSNPARRSSCRKAETHGATERSFGPQEDNGAPNPARRSNSCHEAGTYGATARSFMPQEEFIDPNPARRSSGCCKTETNGASSFMPPEDKGDPNQPRRSNGCSKTETNGATERSFMPREGVHGPNTARQTGATGRSHTPQTPREASCHDACLEDSRVCQEPDNAKTQAGHSVMKSLPMPGAILPPTGPDAMVSCRQLRRFVQRPPSTAPAGWKRRFRTAGVMPLPLQRSTAGVERCPQVSEGPPYAISRDAECMQALVDEYIVTRCRRMSDCLRRHGSPDREGWLTTEEFAAALRKVERYGTSAREVEALVDVLDPKNTGFVGIQDFLTRFAIEFLKGKSSRLTIGTDGNDGRVNLMQWPESLRTTYSKDRLLEALRRRRRFGRPPRGKVPETKTVVRTTRR